MYFRFNDPISFRDATWSATKATFSSSSAALLARRRSMVASASSSDLVSASSRSWAAAASAAASSRAPSRARRSARTDVLADSARALAETDIFEMRSASDSAYSVASPAASSAAIRSSRDMFSTLRAAVPHRWTSSSRNDASAAAYSATSASAMVMGNPLTMLCSAVRRDPISSGSGRGDTPAIRRPSSPTRALIDNGVCRAAAWIGASAVPGIRPVRWTPPNPKIDVENVVCRIASIIVA